MANNTALTTQKSKSFCTDMEKLLVERCLTTMQQSLRSTQAEAQAYITAALNSARRNPALMECSRASFSMAVQRSAEFGLPADGRMACIVPYKGEAQYQPMYQGVLELAWARAPRFNGAFAEIVYEADEFRYSVGLHPDIHHVPAQGKRGKPVGCYVVIRIKDADPIFGFMSAEEIKAHAGHYSKAMRGNTPWKDAGFGELEMWKKTVFLKVMKWAPKGLANHALMEAIADNERDTTVLDDDDYEIEDDPKSKAEPNPKAEPDPEPEPEPEPYMDGPDDLLS